MTRSFLFARWILRNRVLLVVMTFAQVTMAQIEIHFTEEPRNVTVQEHDNVYIPCRSNTSLLPTWIINGKEYSSSLGLPDYFLLNTTHLIIPNIALFLNGTVAQCFLQQIVVNIGLVRTYSTVGVITITDAAVEQFLVTSSSVLPEPTAVEQFSATSSSVLPEPTAVEQFSATSSVLPELSTSYMQTSTISLKHNTFSTMTVDLPTSSEDVNIPTVVTIEDINEVNLLAVWSSLVVCVFLLFFISIFGVALTIILVKKKAHRQHMLNHPISPNPNPAYDTWVFLERRGHNQSTETGIKTETNCAYGQRKDFVLAGHNCISRVGEQV